MVRESATKNGEFLEMFGMHLPMLFITSGLNIWIREKRLAGGGKSLALPRGEEAAVALKSWALQLTWHP